MQSQCKLIRKEINALNQVIVASSAQDSLERKAASYGLALLKELAFRFLTIAQDEVSDQTLRYLLLKEYATIIKL